MNPRARARFNRFGALSILLVACARAAAPPADAEPAQAAPDNSAEIFASEILARFTSGAPASFDSVYPFGRGRGMVAFAAQRDLPRIPGIGRVAWTDGEHALVVLAGHVEFGNSGDETGYADAFSGVYEARRVDGVWRLDVRVPLDSLARIGVQSMDVRIEPGLGLRVVDSMRIDVRGSQGFAARLNHAAEIAGVRLNGAAVEHEFGGGLLWVRAPAGESSLVVDYRLDVASDSTSNPNSGRFEAEYGHVRNQYYWHPRVGWSDFVLRVRAPADVHVATDLAQRERLAGGERILDARSRAPATAVTLVYDAAWTPSELRIDNTTLVLFTSPDFTPPADSLAAEFRRTYELLDARFGEPASSYFSIVQQRALSGRGWLWRSNEMIGAAAQGSPVVSAGPPPRASFGHEISHGWVHSTGPASNFLGEGWAMYAESMLIEDALGAEAEAVFWAHRRNLYYLQGNEGRASIIDDPGNAGIAYTKGPWILRMLEDYIGEAAFERGFRAYMAIPPGRAAGIEEFSEAMSRAAGRDVWPFLRPWIEETVIPDVRARIEDGRVVIAQQGPAFLLPLHVDLLTDRGVVRRSVLLDQREGIVSTAGLGAVAGVVLDPDHRLLIRRHRGEMARFEVEAPGATEVLLVPDFSREPLPATQSNGVWSVTVPLSAGAYLFDWRIDGTDIDGGVRRVSPDRLLESPYPL